MPKRRQIPRLFWVTLAGNIEVAHWKPEKRLRAAGFHNVKLGSDRVAATVRAMELNDQVAAWDAAGATASADGLAPTPRQLPRIVRFDELITRYRAADAFTGLSTSTRAEYNVRLRQLEHWAMDGTLAVRDIDAAMVRELRNALVKGSPFVAASMLRVLRLLLSWAKREGIVSTNAATDSVIPEPPSRATVSSDAERETIAAHALALKLPEVALAIDLGFWTLQRQGDILALNRLAWRELHNVDPRHAAQLVDAKGRVMAFRLRQKKTGAWVDAPIPPMLHDRIEAALEAGNGWLFGHPDRRGDRALPQHLFQRRYRAARDAAHAAATKAGDELLATALAGNQFRDLRRTGMTFYSNQGAILPWITALSGHSVIGRKTILDTYMPGNTAGACACVATGLAGLAAMAEREKQA